MNVAYLCLGGNIGDRNFYFTQAIQLICEQVGNIVSKSSLYETEAWGADNQQAYLNCCVQINTKLSSSELIHKLLDIEQQLGRIRNPSNQYQARTIDIDILFFNNDIIQTDLLIVPHPRMHLRKFVLVPLNEIASNFLHSTLNKTIFNLLKSCSDTSHVTLYK